jgi:hypothetical protein
MGFAVIAAVLAALVVFVVAMYYWLREEGKTVSGRLNDPLIENDALERGRAPRSDDLEGSGAGIALQVTAPKARMALIDSKELEFGDKLAEGGAAVVSINGRFCSYCFTHLVSDPSGVCGQLQVQRYCHQEGQAP